MVSDQNHSFGERTRILRDRETGVNYVYHWAGTAGGLTTLLNADGTPVVTES
ncbi:xylan 1,4-beta-xylosidase [Micrococcales bacterium 31B]|nr:xylan 1,4-beta-xylosidase [Micrococcales bacterium 31B]